MPRDPPVTNATLLSSRPTASGRNALLDVFDRIDAAHLRRVADAFHEALENLARPNFDKRCRAVCDHVPDRFFPTNGRGHLRFEERADVFGLPDGPARDVRIDRNTRILNRGLPEGKP